MHNEELWQKFVQANPEFDTTGVNFTAKGLRRFFDLVYSQGYDEGRNECFDNTDSYHATGNDSGNAVNQLKKIFGMT
jgi:hypothetical protein